MRRLAVALPERSGKPWPPPAGQLPLRARRFILRPTRQMGSQTRPSSGKACWI